VGNAFEKMRSQGKHIDIPLREGGERLAKAAEKQNERDAQDKRDRDNYARARYGSEWRGKR